MYTWKTLFTLLGIIYATIFLAGCEQVGKSISGSGQIENAPPGCNVIIGGHEDIEGVEINCDNSTDNSDNSSEQTPAE